jgi:type I restriction enzyme S subunit
MSDMEMGIERATRLRQSILKRAFEGKLVPQDPNDEPASVLLERIRDARAAESTQRAHKRRKASA